MRREPFFRFTLGGRELELTYEEAHDPEFRRWHAFHVLDNLPGTQPRETAQVLRTLAGTQLRSDPDLALRLFKKAQELRPTRQGAKIVKGLGTALSDLPPMDSPSAPKFLTSRLFDSARRATESSVLRDDLLRGAQADLAFVTTTAHKADRERWVVEQWLLAQGLNGIAIAPGDDPPDFYAGRVGIEVVEAMEPGRKRGDEYRADVDAAKEGRAKARRRPSLGKVRDCGHEWIFLRAAQKAFLYDPSAASRWVLLVYANFFWADRVRWEVLEAELANLSPPFVAIDVVYRDACGAVRKRIFERERLEPPL